MAALPPRRSSRARDARTNYLDDGTLPIDNNWGGSQIRLIAFGRNNRLFSGSMRTGKRAVSVVSVIHSARRNGHDAYASMQDILERAAGPAGQWRR